MTLKRDYSLIGPEASLAVANGLAEAEWYKSPVPAERMRELLVRKDFPAIRDTIIWFGLIIGSGYLVFLLRESWALVFPYMVYSVLYASTSDSRWHESGHGTAFRTDWMNNALYEIASFMVFRQSTVWRWSHIRHHSDTIVRGRDPEIAVPRPPDLRKILLSFVGITGAVPEMRRIIIHASGRIDREVATYLPEYEYSAVIVRARIYLFIYLSVIILSVYFHSFLPLLYIGLPTLFGSWLMPVYGLTQHAGLQENVLDHRLNCRTVYMNRVHRFLYWNMNYHIEHHMFPLVPYHALPELHASMKDDCPVPYKNIAAAYREIIPALLRQIRDVSYYVERRLPERKHPDQYERVRKITGDPHKAKDGRAVVCDTDEIRPGEILRFDINHKTYAVYRTVRDEYFATDGFCTHGNAHLAEGMIIGDMIECMKHNGRFRLTDGSPARKPVCEGIKTYRTYLSEGQVMVDLAGDNDDDKAGLRSFVVTANRNLTPFIRELVLQPEDKIPLAFYPGQYVRVTVPPFRTAFSDLHMEDRHRDVWRNEGLLGLTVENDLFISRPYSMANGPDQTTDLILNVRIALPPAGSAFSPGAGSSYLFGLNPGERLNLSGPYGTFLVKHTGHEMIYIGGGAGMAPIRSHISSLLEDGNHTEKISYWYGARSSKDIYYEDYFRQLERQNSNFSFHIALSEEKDDDRLPAGYIHNVLYEKYLASHPHPDKIDYYLCGPPAMISAASSMLRRLGVPERSILYDEF